jgi:hypothetical protein
MFLYPSHFDGFGKQQIKWFVIFKIKKQHQRFKVTVGFFFQEIQQYLYFLVITPVAITVC